MKPPTMPPKSYCKQPNIAGVYNVAGGSRGLAEALAELQRAHRPIIYHPRVEKSNRIAPA